VAHPAARRGERRGNRVVAVSPSLSGVVLPGSVTSAAAKVMAAISVVTTGASAGVSLAAPPSPAVVEEEREAELPASPVGGLHG